MAITQPSAPVPLYRITAPHFCAGYAHPHIAPIIKYMFGWSHARIAAYCASKGWKLEVL